jgi:hypothetical protein
MRLTFTGSVVRGAYMYLAFGRDLALEGSLDPSGTMTLTERFGSRTTGQFELRPESTRWKGTWSDPSGHKSLTAALEPKTLPVVQRPRGSLAPPKVAPDEHGVPPSSDRELGAFMLRYARWKRTPAGREWFRKKAWNITFREELAGKVVDEERVPIYSGLLYLFVADVNNDGTTDFVLVSTHEGAYRGEHIFAIFDVSGDELREVEWNPSASCPACDVVDMIQDPFIVTGPRGNRMNFEWEWGITMKGSPGNAACTECCGSYREAISYLWKDGRFSILTRSREVVPCQ